MKLCCNQDLITDVLRPTVRQFLSGSKQLCKVRKCCCSFENLYYHSKSQLRGVCYLRLRDFFLDFSLQNLRFLRFYIFGVFFAFLCVFLHFCVFCFFFNFFQFSKKIQIFFSRNFLEFFFQNFFLQNFSRIFGENFKSLAQKMAEILGWYAFRTLGMYVYGSISPSDYTVQTLELKLKSQSLDNSRKKNLVFKANNIKM